MTALRETLVEQLSRFDDAAFEALANRGLLRRARKDLEKQDPVILEDTPTHLELGVGEHRVRFDARGPAFAQCSCPAGTICQHILAAALSLQARAAQSEPASASPAATVPDDAPAAPLRELHDALLAMSQAVLVKHAGKAGYRWAWQFVQDLDPESGLSLGGERHVVIGFRHPSITFRYMGGGPESLVADVQTTQLAKQQVAAVLAYRRAHGVDIPEPESVAKASAPGLDLGKDHAPAVRGEEDRHDSRDRLRTNVQRLLEDCVGLGLSHLSAGIQQRFATVAVWAQGAEYYRLALLLRRIADHVEMLLERAGGADEERLFEEMSLAAALTSALGAADARGESPARLLGRSRSRYEEVPTLELLGLGAHAWHSASGYLGLTMLFWSPKEQRFFACTDARPELQRGFDPVARYRAAGPWSGLGAPAHATGRSLTLIAPHANRQGRLSLSEATTATVRDAPGFADRLAPCRVWAELAASRSRAMRSLLAEPEPMRDWVVLEPARWTAAQFDPVRQSLTWVLEDRDGEGLELQLPYSPYTEHAITRIEQCSKESPREGTLVVVRLHTLANGIVGEPLSLVRRSPRPGENVVDALHFDAPPTTGTVSRWVARLRQLGTNSGTGGSPAPAPVSDPGHPALVDCRLWLQRQAERGFADERETALEAEFKTQMERLQSRGYLTFGKLPSPSDALARSLLQANYVCLQYEQLVDGSRANPIDD